MDAQSSDVQFERISIIVGRNHMTDDVITQVRSGNP